MDLGFDIPAYEREVPVGQRHCNECHRNLPESEFGTNPFLGVPFTRCRQCFATEARTLARRLEWYVRRWREHAERDALPPVFPPNLPTDRHSLERWLVDNAETTDGARTARYARNISAPDEEIDRLIGLGKIDPIDIMPGAAEIENDPYGGYKARYRHFKEMFHE